MARITLEQWIEEALTDQDKDGPCTAMACVYKSPDGKVKEVHSLKLSGRTWSPKSLSDLFRGKAEHFAQDLGGLQRFELLAYYKDRTEPQAVHPFSVYDGQINASGKIVKEGPDKEGVLAQAMRHYERNEEMLGRFMEVMGRMVETTGKHLQEAREEVNDAYVIVRDMMMKQQQLDHERRMKELEFERSTEERKRFLGLVPALANVVSGKEVFPQSVADSAILDAISEKVDPKAIEQLISIGMIDAETAGPLILRLKEARERMAKEKKALKLLPGGKDELGDDPKKNEGGK